MLKRFIFAHEDQPDKAWLTRFVTGREEAERWYLGRGRSDPPTVDEFRGALSVHTPELLPHYDRVCALVGNDDLPRQMLSHYRPPPVIGACSQAVWFADGGPALVRNYDFDLDVVSGRFEVTSWSGRKVIAKAQRPWGWLPRRHERGRAGRKLCVRREPDDWPWIFDHSDAALCARNLHSGRPGDRGA